MDKKKPGSNTTDNVDFSFRPVTEGLGFHPFSDGLPYAPIGKTPKSTSNNPKSMSTTGSGATAAGPPIMVTPKKLSTQVQKAREVPALPPARLPAPPPVQVPRISVPVAKKTVANSEVVHSPKPPLAKSEWGITYVIKRALSYLFDVSFNSLLMGGILFVLVWKGELQLDLLMGYGVPAGIGIFFLVSSWGLIGLQEVLFRGSLGKYLFELRLDGSRFKILVRTLLFPLSVGFFGLGIFWGLFHGRRSCWHDILTDIQPIRSDKTE